MRRLFLLFMIVLLPLRGWAGDLMSIQMATSGSANAMPADCPMLAQVDAGGHGSDDTQAPAGMDNCASCELCIPMAELTGTRLGCVSGAAHAKPPMGPAGFLSASPTPTFKPPIS